MKPVKTKRRSDGLINATFKCSICRKPFAIEGLTRKDLDAVTDIAFEPVCNKCASHIDPSDIEDIELP